MVSNRYEIGQIQEEFKDSILLGKVLGKGEFGIVCAGQYKGHEVAVKVLDIGAPQIQSRGYDKSVSDFMREYALLSALDSEHVVHVYDAGVRNGYYYIVMEHGGCKLSSLQRGRASMDNVKRAYFCIASGLRDLHLAGIIHRDIKPDNILIGEDGTFKITDLGMGHRETRVSRGQKEFAFTPIYAAPEQLVGEYSPASDVHSLGIVIYELLTGHLPYGMAREEARRLTYEELSDLKNDDMVPATDFRGDIPPELLSILDESLQIVPADRIPSKVLAYDMGRIMAGQPPSSLTLLNDELLYGRRIDSDKVSEWKESEFKIPEHLGDEISIDTEGKDRRDYKIEVPHHGGKIRVSFNLILEGIHGEMGGDFAVILASEDWGESTPNVVKYGDVFRVKFPSNSNPVLEYRTLGRRRKTLKMPFSISGPMQVSVERFPDKALFVVDDEAMEIDNQYRSPSVNQEVWLSGKGVKLKLPGFGVYHEKGGERPSSLLAIERSFAEGQFRTTFNLAGHILYDSDPGDPRIPEARLYQAMSLSRRSQRDGDMMIDDAIQLLQDVRRYEGRIAVEAGIELANIMYYLKKDYEGALMELEGILEITDDPEVVISRADWFALNAPKGMKSQFNRFKTAVRETISNSSQ